MKYLIYCTKAKPYLAKEKWNTTDKPKWITTNIKKMDWAFDFVNGHIVAECEMECEKIKYLPYECTFYTNTLDTVVSSSSPISSFEKASCLSYFELDEYLNNYETDKAVGYALHISNLKVFDEPLNVNQFKVRWRKQDKQTKELFGKNAIAFKWLEKAPQNICKVYRLDDSGEYYDEYIFIPCSSKELCNYLNGKATIVIRKKILKGMI